jgi:hypothetical protein
VLAFNDGSIASALSPAFRFPDVIFRFWDNQSFFGQAHGSILPSLPNVLEVVFGPHHYRREGTWLGVWFVGLAGYWTIRQFHRSRPAALLAALLLMLCGWTLTAASVGLLVRGTSVAWAAISLGVLERNRTTGAWLGYSVAGGALGLGVSDVADVGILLGLSCGMYFLCAHWLVGVTSRDWNSRPLIGFSIYVLTCLAIAYPTLHTVAPATHGQLPTADSADGEFAWATQWSLPPAETWSLVAIDYHGASSRSRTTPYWGTMGQSPDWERSQQGYANFRLQGYAMGVVPVILLTILHVYLAGFRDSKLLETGCAAVILPLTGIAIVSLLLSWGNHFALYRYFYAVPYMSSMRNPEKWLGPLSLCVAVCLAYAVDLVRAMGLRGDIALNRRILVRSGTILVAIPIVAVFLVGSANPTSFSNTLTQLRIDQQRIAAAWVNAQWSNIQVFVVSLSGFGLLWLLLLQRRAWFWDSGTQAVAAVGCLMAAELLKGATPYVDGYSYAHLLRPTTLTSRIDGLHNDGRLKLLPPRHPVLNEWRLTYLTLQGYDLFDPVSVRRLPPDDAWLLRELKSHVTLVWELGSVRYFLATPEFAHQLTELQPPRGVFVVRERLPANHWDPNLGVVDDPICLVEFTAAMPFFQLVTSSKAFDVNRMEEVVQQLCSPGFDPRTCVFLDLAAGNEHFARTAPPGDLRAEATVTIEKNEANFAQVAVDAAMETILVRSVKYNPDWRVTIDGIPCALWRANGFFQGVVVPPGQHTVTFAYQPSLAPLFIYVAGRVALAIGVLVHTAFAWV